jgi:hypothetical protein
LINDYRSFVFTYPIATLSQNGSSDTPFSESERESITNSYFLYLASLLPFYYEAEKITYEGIGQKKSYKWSKEDFKLLVRLLLQKWYYKDWDNFSFEERLKNGLTIENRTATALSLIKNSSKLKSSFFNSQEKCDKVIYPSTLNEQVIEEMNLQCFSESQLILLRSYLSDFIKGIPGSLIRFNDSFYESGSFLKKYFSWS